MSGYLVMLEVIGSPSDTEAQCVYGPFRLASAAEAFVDKIQRALPPPSSDGSIISVHVWPISDATMANVRADGWLDVIEDDHSDGY